MDRVSPPSPLSPPLPEFQPPPAAEWIVRTLEGRGFETWAVGGSVRDTLAGRASTDWDFATRAHPREVMRAFRRTVPIGVDHGTVGVLSKDGDLYEVTTFRRDVETDGRHARVAFAETLEEDLARRDFTINAMAWHPLRKELRDPYRGLEDLGRGVIRTVGDPGERFREDHLRILRALRFAGDFGFRVESGTWEALRNAVPALPLLSAERLREELLKSLALPSATGILELYRTSGALTMLYPEVADGDWDEILGVVAHLPHGDPRLRLAGLLSRIPPFPGGGGGGDPGMPRILAVLERLRLSNADVRRLAGVADGVRRPPIRDEPAAYRLWLSRVGREWARSTLKVAGALARTHARGGKGDVLVRHTTRVRGIRRELNARNPLSQGELALDGRDLMRMGFRPGPQFGRILESALHAVLEVPSLNTRESLEALVRELWTDGA